MVKLRNLLEYVTLLHLLMNYRNFNHVKVEVQFHIQRFVYI